MFADEVDTVIPFEKLTAYVRRCNEDSLTFLQSKYKEEGGVNWDEVKIWAIQRNTGFGKDYSIKYGNLYSYVLSRGIVVPYSEWIYESEVELDGRLCSWDKETKKGMMENKYDIGK